MQRRTMMGMAMLVLVIVSAHTAMGGRAAKRQGRQDRRIERGITSGRLTGREADRLAEQQRKIQRDKQAAMADGQVTRAERRHVRREQNRASRNIFRKKHNGRSTW